MDLTTKDDAGLEKLVWIWQVWNSLENSGICISSLEISSGVSSAGGKISNKLLE